MSDIELVIKIDEKDYQSLKDGHIPFNVLDTIMRGMIMTDTIIEEDTESEE